MEMSRCKIFDNKYTLAIRPAAVEKFVIEWWGFAELPKAHIVTTFDGSHHISYPRERNWIDGTSDNNNLHCSMAYYPSLTPLGAEKLIEIPLCARCLKAQEKYFSFVEKNPNINYVVRIREYLIEGFGKQPVTVKKANWNLNTFRRENKWKVSSKTPTVFGRTYKDDKYPLIEATAAIFNIPVEDVRLEEAAALWREMGFDIANCGGRKQTRELLDFFKAVPDVLDLPVKTIELETGTRAAVTPPKIRAEIEKTTEIRSLAENEFLTAEKARFLDLLGWLDAHKINLTASERLTLNPDKIKKLKECVASLSDDEWQLLTGLYAEFT